MPQTVSNVTNVVKTGKSHNWQSWTFAGLHTVPVLNNAAIGAGLTGSTISGSIVLPQYCKIPKVAIAYASSDLFNGTETFNILVEAAGDGTPAGQGTGYGASYTPSTTALQNTGYPDNSLHWGYPEQNAPQSPANSGIGAGPVFFPVGATLFEVDVPFSVATFTSGSASGGVAVLQTTNWDGVFAAGTVLSVRFVTTASTGSITKVALSLLVEVLDDYITDSASQPILNW